MTDLPPPPGSDETAPPPGQAAPPPPPAPPSPGYWQASDGQWYPPSSAPPTMPMLAPGGAASTGPPPAATATTTSWVPPADTPTTSDATHRGPAPGPGWWLASDGNWYAPTQNPGPGPTHPAGAAVYGYPVAPRNNGYAIAAMVLGIVWLWGIGSVLALIFGYKSRREIDRSNGTQTGRGMAIAGIVLGWVGLVGIALIVFLGVITAGSYNSDPVDGVCNNDRYMQDPDC